MAIPLRLTSQRYLLPATEIAVDEMMVKFMGKSSHTIKIKISLLSKDIIFLRYVDEDIQ